MHRHQLTLEPATPAASAEHLLVGRCTCGWSSEAGDEFAVRRGFRAHLAAFAD